jgi:hypothetical protein
MPAQSWLQRVLDLLEPSPDRLGLTSLPPVVHCLMYTVKRHSAQFLSDPVLRARMQKLQIDMDRTWRKTDPDVQSPPLIAVMQMPTPDSIHQPLSSNPMTGQVVKATDTRSVQADSRGGIREALEAGTDQQIESLIDATRPSQSDPRYPEIPGDLESFFDDLASLDNANKLENQPQFMQNLGFAPDASMADLFSEFIPMQSSAFIGHDSSDIGHLDHYNFYDAS